MTRPLALVLAAALFALLSTANSGGYRYGVSDQAFYGPAIAMSADPSLFPRDRAVLAPQMKLWVGDSLFAGLGRLSGADLPTLFVTIYGITLLALFAAAVIFARRLGADWWTIAAFLILLTLRHRIAKTGANSLEGYMHPRILAFAFGLLAFAAIARWRPFQAVAWTAAAAVVHTTAAIWFGAAVAGALAWRQGPRRAVFVLAATTAAAAVAALTVGSIASRLTVMDPAWLAVLGDKDYLFSAEWPVYAWLVNLAYPAVIWLVYRRRRARGATAPGEGELVAGLFGLVAIFLVSVPLAERHLALAVQLQVNRVFWLLDAMAMFYLAWWVMADLTAARAVRLRGALIAVLLAISISRGYYIVHLAADRKLVEVGLPATPWVEAMVWLRTQPAAWHVLADPRHAWVFGPSVRVAAERDTLLELNKDSALAMYDRDLALRVADRLRDYATFEYWTTADVRALAAKYQLDVFVDVATRHFDFPILHRNAEFIVYDLR